MSDNFIREVNEEYRREQARVLWNRYGPIAIGVALIVILATSAYVAYDYWMQARADRSGDQFSAALALVNEGKADEALASLETLEKEGHGAYPVLARMRAATVLAGKGDHAAAVSGFDAVANDGSVPMSIRDMARLRAALLLVDHSSYSDVSARVESLAADTNPLRHSAREALGLAAWKEGKLSDALKLFEQISADNLAPQGMRQRANLMVELIRGAGTES